ncbi:MAG: matrixin family metalloprotease [Phycisphaerae bacterium]|nr:matrixin family metalloprotease [Phycisphaerae bacterium]
MRRRLALGRFRRPLDLRPWIGLEPLEPRALASAAPVTAVMPPAIQINEPGMVLVESFGVDRNSSGLTAMSASGLVISEMSADFSTAGQWPQPGGDGARLRITYSYSNLLDGQMRGLSATSARGAVEEAFGLWARYAPLDFVEVRDSGPGVGETNYFPGSGPQIRLGHHGFGGPGGTLAHAYLPFQTSRSGLAGDIHFDRDDRWSLSPAGGIDLIEVAAHEIGHALGLEHSGAGSAIMAPFYGRRFGGPGTGFLSSDDIAGIRSIYGAGFGSVTPLSGGPFSPPTPPTSPPSPPPAPRGDRYEQNDSRAEVDGRPAGGLYSPNFGTLDRQVIISRLDTLDDATDWYRFQTTATAGATDHVEITLNPARGDLDLAVYRADGSLVGRSAGRGGSDRVELAGESAGVYYAHVEAFEQARNPDYSLIVDPPSFQANAGGSSLVVGLGADAARSLVYTDADGTRAHLRIGSGSGDVAFRGDGIRQVDGPGNSILVTGQNLVISRITISPNATGPAAAASLRITARGGDDRIAVGDVEVEGNLGVFHGPQVQLLGDLVVEGFVRRLYVHDVVGGSVRVEGDAQVSSPTLGSTRIAGSVRDAAWWIEGSAGRIAVGVATNWDLDVAGNLAGLRLRGSASDLNLSVGGRLAVATAIDWAGSTIRTDSLGVLMSRKFLSDTSIQSQGDVDRVSLGGMRDSSVYAGVRRGLAGLPKAADDFDALATVKSLRISLPRSAANSRFVNSNVAAAGAGQVNLGTIQFLNGGDLFGFSFLDFRAVHFHDFGGNRYTIHADQVLGESQNGDFVMRRP